MRGEKKIDLKDLKLEKEANVIQDGLNALGNGSEYEFCGKIRSSLEQIVEELIILKGKAKTERFHINLQILKNEKIIDSKLAKSIHSNYSYGSQFIHNEVDLSTDEAKVFVRVDKDLNISQDCVNNGIG